MEHAFRAVEHLHNKRILHLDIKPQNFIAVGNMIKLIDFTGARMYTSSLEVSSTKVHVTSIFLPPGMYSNFP
jgi:serine/threonine protein kinase